MKQRHSYYILIILLSTFFNGCYYNKLEQVQPQTDVKDPNDSTVATTYNESVKFIIESNCISCHDKDVASGGIILDSYESVFERANSGLLMNVILHKKGYPAMPPGYSLQQSEINKIQQWIDAKLPQ